MSYKLIVNMLKILKEENSKLKISLYEDGFAKINDDGRISYRRLKDKQLVKLKDKLHEYIKFTSDYIKKCEDTDIGNCKIIIKMTNPYKNRPFTKVVNDTVLFNELFKLVLQK